MGKIKIIENKKLAMGMYDNPEIAAMFARSEREDEKLNTVISTIIDTEVVKRLSSRGGIVKIANLGAGANPQKYPKILDKIKTKNWEFDWVDLSAPMLEIARASAKEFNLPDSINFHKNDFIGYLDGQKNNSLDCVIMQYCINYIDSLEDFFSKLSKKLKNGGMYIANVGSSRLTNFEEATFLINGKEISGTVDLAPGDVYTIQFLDSDGKVYATTQKNFFSDEEISNVAKAAGLSVEFTQMDKFNVVIIKK